MPRLALSSGRLALVTALLAPAVGLLGAEASAQGLSERIKAVGEQKREALKNDSSRASLLGALVYTDVTVDFSNTDAKTAFDYLAQQLGVPLVVRYEGKGGADGIDETTEITFSAEGENALTVLERMLEMCENDEDCTWQIRDGYIEAGPKSRLGVKAAQELRMYPIRDLLFEPPTFDNAPDFNLGAALQQGGQMGGGMGGGGMGGGGGGFGGGGGGFGGGGGGMGGGGMGGGGGGGGIIGDPGDDPERPSEEEKADQLMDIIREQCEPDAWSDNGGDWASMRYYQGVLIIRAPDFVHRQIDGYPFAPKRPRSAREPGAAGKAISQAETDASRRYVTFTTGFSIVDNVKFRGVPVEGAVGGTGIGN